MDRAMLISLLCLLLLIHNQDTNGDEYSGSHLPVVFSRTQEFDIQKNYQVTQLDFLREEYVLTFDLLLTNLDSGGFFSILHLTIGSDIGDYGDRTPAVWLINKQFCIVSAISGNINMHKYINPPLKTNAWMQFEISQLFVTKKHMFRVRVDGKLYWELENNAPKMFPAVTMFGSDDWYRPASGKIRNLLVKTSAEETASIGPPTTASSSCKCGVQRTARIVGGTETEVNEYPWMALLANSVGSSFCGGTLIASQWVLTAGHCMFIGTQPQKADALKVILGEHDITSSSESKIPRKVVQVSKIITHPSFSAETNNNDIALLKLSEEVDIHIYTPSCIAMASDNFEGQKAWVYGWGHTRSDKLLKVEVPVVSNVVCQAAMDANITNGMLCAGGELGKDSCKGDSGGPLTVSVSGQHTLIGCVSFGKGCGEAGKYGVYGDVAYFRPWIDYTVSNNGGAKYCHGEAPAAPVCPAWSGAEEPTCPAPRSFKDPPLLFVGPGYGRSWGNGISEIFSLPPVGQEANITLPITDCYIPTYPHTVTGSLAFTIGGTLTICGGSANAGMDKLNSCFSLTNFTWTASAPMLSPRDNAAALLLPNHTVLVSGGSGGRWVEGMGWVSGDDGRLNSTEVYNGEVWQLGPFLPYPVADHCMLYLSGYVVIVGGGSYWEVFNDTYAYNLANGSWTRKASMTIPRRLHACSVLDGEIWVGGTYFENPYPNATTEIYNIVKNEWRQGPQLPYWSYCPGKFVTHGRQLLYVGGEYKKMIHQLNKEKNAWIFIRDMAEERAAFPALVITESACYGVSYSDNIGAVGGSMLKLLNTLTDASLKMEVSCCIDGELTVKTCGDEESGTYVPCDKICGQTNEISAILDIDEDDSSICDARYISVPIYRISYCVRRVTTLQALDRNRICCLHPYVSRRPGVKDKCCKSYGWCI